MTIQASGEYTLQDIRRAVSSITRGNRLRLILVAVFAVLSVGGGLSLYVFTGKTHDLPLTLFGFILAGVYWILPIFSSYRQWKSNPNIQGTHTVELDEQGYRANSPNGHTELRWSAFLKWKENRHLFLLYGHPRIAQILPKHFFANQVDLEAARQLFATHIQKRK